MRGRRRRNRSSPVEEQEKTEADPDSGVGGDGAVKLVESRPPPGAGADQNAETASDLPPGLQETISDVATAHAHLDSVLSPDKEGSADQGPQVGASDVSAPESPSTPMTPYPQEMPVEPSAADPAVATSMVVDTEMPTGPPPASDLESDQGETPNASEVTEETPDTDAEPQAASGNPLPRVMAVANQKGGVGKTTTSVNLGAALAELGYRVLVIDLDPQGNATTGLGIDARNFELSMYDVMMRDASLEDCVEPTSLKNLFVAPATIALAGAEIELVPAFSRELKLKRALEPVIDDFDYLIIDCPPSLGLITVNALAAADEVLVPIQCEYYALEGLSQLMRNVHLVASNLNPKLDISTIVLTMYDARTKLADQVADEVRQHFGTKVCRIVIPRTVRLSEAPSFGQPITTFDPSSRGAIAYRELAKEVSGGAP